MTLKMVHLIAYHTDDGVIIGIHDNHVERDQDFEEAQKIWYEELGHTGKCPTQRMDALVPDSLSPERLNKMLKEVIMRAVFLKMLDQILN